jgi:hypothetical protein
MIRRSEGKMLKSVHISIKRILRPAGPRRECRHLSGRPGEAVRIDGLAPRIGPKSNSTTPAVKIDFRPESSQQGTVIMGE